MMRSNLLNIFFIISIPVVLFGITMMPSQQVPQDYVALWKQVDSLEQNGLIQSATDKVEIILAKTKSENNGGQYIKALIYKAKYINHKQEDATQKIIALYNKEIESAKTPEQQILQSILAEFYWRYYTNNRWVLLNRNETLEKNSDDITTWAPTDFMEKVIELYRSSLTPESALQQVPIRNYEIILVGDSLSPKFRPTIYDFLAHRAIDFYKNEEANIRKPVYAFKMDDPAVFFPPAAFARQKFETKDTLDLKYQALLIFQKLTTFHLGQNQPEPLIMVTLERLKFAFDNSVLPTKGALYLQALEVLEKEYKGTSLEAEIKYFIAQYHFDVGQRYDPLTSDAFKWEKSLALKTLNETEALPKDSVILYKIEQLKQSILKKTHEIIVEEVNLPDEPFRALVSYQNIPNLYFRAIVLTEELKKELMSLRVHDSLKLRMLRLTPFKTWSTNIPDEKDYQYHRVEVKIPALPQNSYLIIASHDSTFSGELISYGYTHTSNLGVVERDMQNGRAGLYIFNRHSGDPLAGAKIAIYQRTYEYTSRDYKYNYVTTLTTDNTGFADFKPSNQNNDYQLIITHKKDRLVVNENIYAYLRNRDTKEKTLRTFFFTDRKIYRPGQTIYFKGLVVEKDNKNPEKAEVSANHKTTVTFYDVNRQKIAEQVFTANEYGTFSGTFTAPAGLTGQMQIKNELNGTFIRVEEYKRPKFEVKFEPITSAYRLNDTVHVEGNAIAFAGPAVDNALVQYRVQRNAIYPYIFFRWRDHFQSNAMEITSGVTTTDSTGKFIIDFKAIPDPTIDPALKPQFVYAVYASVTDISGETQSTETRITAGYVSLNLEVEVPENVMRDSLLKIAVKSLNLNNQPEPTEVKLNIYKLQEPDRVFRNRMWPEPDQFIFSKKEYYDLFPHDIYNNEDEIRNWPRAAEVITKTINTGSANELAITEAANWKTGAYEIEVTAKDKYGEEVKFKKYFTLYDLDEKKIPLPEILWTADIKMTAEPGEEAKFAIGTATEDLKVLYEVIKDNKIIHKEWVKLDEEQKTISIPITEAHRGNLAVQLMTVKFGRLITLNKTVIVPWSNKDLKLEFSTFRDKLRPGQEEQWTVKLSGPKGEKVAAEMVAAMYDASLDAFAPNSFYFGIYPTNYSGFNWNSTGSFSVHNFNHFNERYEYPQPFQRFFDQLDWFGFYFGQRYYSPRMGTRMGDGAYYIDGIRSKSKDDAKAEELQSVGSRKTETEKPSPPPAAGAANQAADEQQAEAPVDLSDVPVRENLNETAFFFPHLLTDEEGNFSFSFTMPEALTRWNFLSFAHTKDLKYGFLNKSIVTQKELMVQVNAPRFFRIGDEIFFTSKISNLTDEHLQGQVKLELFDAITMKGIFPTLISDPLQKDFSVKGKQSSAVVWKLNIPSGVEAIQYKIVAKAGDFSDGETSIIPVLSNQILVTETLPLQVRGAATKTFTLDKLLNHKSNTLRNHKLTMEFTANPAWYAVQALPYLMEYPYECSEQVFNRFYANALAAHTVNTAPRVKQVFEQWKNTDALVSNLEKNQELKSILLQETPWVLQAQSETEQRKRIALLFDMNKMASERAASIRQLRKMQTSNGGWPWFPGMRDDRYITQYIVAGIGHLHILKAIDLNKEKDLMEMIDKAVKYIDARAVEDHKNYLANKDKNTVPGISYININYLYARTLFKDIPMQDETQQALQYFLAKAKDNWTKQNKYMQGMIALAMHRVNAPKTAGEILASLKETSLENEEMGIYWKSNNNGWFWYQAPIETQALLIEAFETITKDKAMVDGMKLWLLKQKQVQSWPTTKATSEAVYALLLTGSNWLLEQPQIVIQLGSQKIDPANIPNLSQEAGTGYFKMSWDKNEIKPEMGKVTVTRTGEGVSWGSIYWQYFEDMDKVTAAQSPLQLQKILYVQRNSDRGPVMEELKSNTKVKVGDKIVARLIIKTDRDMEYIHLKDMRASGLEPLNVLSGYRYKEGLGYYESTRDASTNFFISWLPKGTYVLDYFMVISHKGDFSNGIATIQSMYAPEFAAHSEGVRLQVK